MRALVMVGVFCLLLAQPAVSRAQESARVDAAAAARFAALALDCVHKEYPNKIAHVLIGDADVQPPRELTPAFYGCYDWHSSVHGHWLLARLARTFPGRAVRGAGPRGAGAEPDAGAHRRRGHVPGGRRARHLRAPLRPRLAAAARRRAARVARPAGAAVGRGARAAGGRRREAPRRLAAQAVEARSASASTTRRRSRSAWSSTGRARPATARPATCSRVACGTSTWRTAAARSPTSPRARTSSRRASPRPT